MNELKHTELVKKISIGDVVRAVAGRDNGGLFLVVEVVSEQFVKIADGKTRPIKRPKLKKVKHIRMTGKRLDGIAGKLVAKKAVGDKVLAKALSGVVGRIEL